MKLFINASKAKVSHEKKDLETVVRLLTNLTDKHKFIQFQSLQSDLKK